MLIMGSVFFLRARDLRAQQGASSENQAEKNADTPSLNSYASSAGINRYGPGVWSMVSFEAINPASEPREILTLTYFDGHPNVQYGRRLWVPAHSKRRSSYPIKPPPDDLEANSYEVHTMLIDASSGTEVVLENDDRRMTFSGALPASSTSDITAYIPSGEIIEFDEDVYKVDMVYEFVLATRLAEQLSRKTTYLDANNLPPTPEALEGMDHLVVGHDLPVSDPIGVSAIRHWLHAGGQLWIMLDRTNADSVSLLLGDTFKFEVVDRVGLTEVQFHRHSKAGVQPLGDSRELDEPVEFVRVIAEDCEVLHSINGWPASIQKRIGNGNVIVTTLGPRGWLREWREGEAPIKNPGIYAADLALDELAEQFYVPRNAEKLPKHAFKEVLSEQIGYRIVDRATILGIFSAFCLTLLGTGAYLAQRGQLKLMAWIAPVSAIAVTLVVLSIGKSYSGNIDNTMATGQFVEAVTDSESFQTSGLLAVYNTQVSTASPAALNGGYFLPETAGNDGSIRRMIWKDLNQWQLEPVSFSPGIHVAPFVKPARTNHPIKATCQLTEQGVVGNIDPGPFEDFSDALIATSVKDSLAVSISDDQEFVGSPDRLLPRGEFVSAALLNDEQRRRQSLIEQLIPGPNLERYPNRPTLFAWAKPIDPEFDYPDSTKHTGMTLVAIPLSMQRNPPNTRVVVPATFLPFNAVAGPKQEGSFLAFDNREKTWQASKGTLKVWLRFELPDVVQPMRVTSAEFTVHINGGPLKTLEIYSAQGEESTKLQQQANPVGTIKFAIDDATSMQPDSDGGLLVGINVVAANEKSKKPITSLDEVEFDDGTNKWKIDYVQLQLSGETLPIAPSTN